jgi:hypothetical protein
VADRASLPVDALVVEARAAPPQWSHWLVPVLVRARVFARVIYFIVHGAHTHGCTCAHRAVRQVLVALLGLLHRLDRAMLRTMLLAPTVTRRANVPAPAVVRQLRDDVTTTPPAAAALSAAVAVGSHLGVATATLLGKQDGSVGEGEGRPAPA